MNKHFFKKVTIFIAAGVSLCIQNVKSMNNMENKFSGIVVFGDGLSDMGRYGTLTNNHYPPSAPFYDGRWTNGKVWVEHVAQAFNLSLSMENNFATGGATTGYYNINEPLRAALGLDNKAHILGLLGQVDLFLSSQQTLDSTALYVVWAGGHDFGSYFDYGQPDVQKNPPAENIKMAVEKLKSKGAQYFIVGNMPDISATPVFANSTKKALAQQLVTDFNNSIDKLVADYQKAGKGKMYKIDAYSIFADIALNASKYGFKYTTEAYLPLDYIDFAKPLAPSKYKTIPNAEKGMNEDEFVSFWGLAAGRKVHEIIARKFIEQVKQNEMIQLINTRRSVRKYTNQPVSKTDVLEIVEAGMNAPSAGNEQAWQMVVLTDPDMKAQYAAFNQNAAYVKNAPAAILVCGDKNAQKFGEYYVQDCSAATQNILLAAHAKGLGAVWCTVFPQAVDGIRKLLNLPENIVPFAIVPLGYPEKSPHYETRFDTNKLHFNKW